MKFLNVIELDIWSQFGCFSKPFSTTGGILSYLIPPKTSIIGMIGAILGYEFDDFEEIEGIRSYKIEKLNSIKISIQPLFDLKTKRVSFNLVEGTKEKIEISNCHQDVLINPYYKLFISFPDCLADEEELFIKRIKNHETVFNLYMGRNEFILSYDFIDVFPYESVSLNNENLTEYSNIKIYGSLNRKFVQEVDLISIKNENNNRIISFGRNRSVLLDSFYEYIITDYPIKRNNFTDFTYSPISFYATKNVEDCYFNNIVFKKDLDKNCCLELTKIGENKWISMI